MVQSSLEPKAKETTATDSTHTHKAASDRLAKHLASPKKASFKKESSKAQATRFAPQEPAKKPQAAHTPQAPEDKKPKQEHQSTPEPNNTPKPTSHKEETPSSTPEVITPKPDEPIQPLIPLATPKPSSPPTPEASEAASHPKSTVEPEDEEPSPAPFTTTTSNEASQPIQVPTLNTKAQTSHVSQSPLAASPTPYTASSSHNPYRSTQSSKALHLPATQGGHKKLIAGIVVGLGCVVVAIYVGFALYFENTFMPNTTLNGTDISLQSKEDVAASLQQKLEDYNLNVEGQGLNFAIGSQDVDLGFDGNAFVDSAIEQTSPWAWPLTLWAPRTIESDQGTTYDEAKLQELVKEQVSALNENAKPPTNASVAFNDASSRFEVTPDAAGTQLDSEAVASHVNQAFALHQTAVSIKDDTLLQPSVTDDDPSLAEVAKKANSYLDATVTLKMNGQDAGSVDSAKIKDWVTIGEDLNPSVNEEAVIEWGKNELSKKLDTIERERTYTRADGKEVTVNGGTYGWSIDSSALAPLIAQAITTGSTQTVDVPILQSASQVPDEGGKDWGNRYIDVDLSEQYVRMYGDDGNVIWEAPCVSGDVSQGHTTPTGVYSINEYFNKEAPASVLVGYYPSGAVEYESPVSYWMPFVGNSVGLHDANWRGSFGGSINYYNGSHGCVNLPVSSAAELCQLVNQGDVVVVHY